MGYIGNQSDGVFDGLAAKQDTLVSGISIKTINGESVLGKGNISVTGSGVVEKIKNLVSTEWNVSLANGSNIETGASNTQSYGFVIERTDGVAAGIKQFGLLQFGINPTTGGMISYMIPFQLNIASQIITVGTVKVIWENSGYWAESNTQTYTDQKSGRFFQSGHLSYPGVTSHKMGTSWGTLTASNTVIGTGYSTAVNKDLYSNYQGSYTVLPASSAVGSGWKAFLNGYMQSTSRATAFWVDFTGSEGSAPTTSVGIGDSLVNTSTHGGGFYVPAHNKYMNTALIGGMVNYQRLSGAKWVSRIYAANSTSVYTDYEDIYGMSIGGNVNNPMFVLSDGRVVTTGMFNNAGSNWYIYSAHNSRVKINNQQRNFPEYNNTFSRITAIGPNEWVYAAVSVSNIYYIKFNTTTNSFETNLELLPTGLGIGSFSTYWPLGNGKSLFIHRKLHGELKFAIGDMPVMEAGNSYVDKASFANYSLTFKKEI